MVSMVLICLNLYSVADILSVYKSDEKKPIFFSSKLYRYRMYLKGKV